MTTRPHLLDRKLLFVTGKGGVGKSTIASSLALLAANEGKRTLVCEVDAKGNLAEFYGTKPLRFAPTEVQSGLFAMTMDTEESLREYLRLQLHLPLISRLGPLAKTFDFVATAAPGVKEILTVGKLAYEVRERNYDMVVVDASATGHVVGQLASPVAMKELVSVGIVRQQTEWMLNILTDPAQTGVVVVATPEEMPVNETIELIDRLDSETDINVAAVIANRVLPELFSRDEEAAFDQLDAEPGRAALAALLGPGSDLVVDAARLAADLRRSRAVHLANLASRLPDTVPLVNVPYLFTRSHGIRTTRQVADRLAEELL
ncbi:MAG TPA: ArsA family ATPase [Microthrixaceae bacterium]|jgi:anion-transporting  ArsA/GET3 family ATPase|nr:ArsA family ATPase [Microthrixaceae bacterium]HQF92533.1 ArsA family ATPase [Microthrixaceae bacterium]